MKRHSTKIKRISGILAINILIDVFSPSLAFALTGGPSQPEVNSFEPVETTQLVDLFSGDFNYNIPLIDVGGYPVNIAYHSGIGMEQESSWVGLGWNINVGNITRNLRGIPDDFKGDKVVKEAHLKKNETWGLGSALDFQLFGFDNLKDNIYQDLKRISNIGMNFGVYHNNYKGIGLKLGMDFTINSNNNLVHFPIGFNSDSQKGFNWRASTSYGEIRKGFGSTAWQGSIGLGYNSLDGMTYLNVNLSTGLVKNNFLRFGLNYITNPTIPIGYSTFIPSFQYSMINNQINSHFTIGGEAFGGHGNLTANGSYSVQKLANQIQSYKAYGFIHDQAKIHSIKDELESKTDLMLDFNRINDASINENITKLPVAIGTYDVLAINGQGTGGSFRAHRNGSGIYFDPKVTNRTDHNLGLVSEIGMELGIGANFHNSYQLSLSESFSKSGIWGKDNELVSNYYQPSNGDNFENVYFKSAGDGGPLDKSLFKSYGGNNPARMELDILSFGTRNINNNSFAKVHNGKLHVFSYDQNYIEEKVLPKYKSKERVSRNSTINYLTNEETQRSIGLESSRNSYIKNGWESSLISVQNARTGKTFRSPKPHHIGEITQTTSEGTRYVYGIPQINGIQKEVVFNVTKGITDQIEESVSTHTNAIDRENGLVSYLDGIDDSNSNTRGSNHFYQGTITPAYAHSFLLTGVLSSDYVDITGDGITNDDLGTAIKFNYNLSTDNYKWRTPYEQNQAKFNEGYLSDKMDDKGSYVYGEKELWYLHSIESKTHVAVFKTSPRQDGYGVQGQAGGIDTSSSSQMMKLDSIILYSKLDLIKNGDNATPVKIVVFEYDYSLCENIPNNKYYHKDSSSNPGKLTLKSIYFTYGKNNRGRLSPYNFKYSNSNPNYSQSNFDCWGNYKVKTSGVPNSEYPFVDPYSSTDSIDKYAESWSLNKIELPSGGIINIQYESDDYAYVQDKKAMSMMMIEGMSDNSKGFESNGNRLYTKNGTINTYLYFKNPDPANINTDAKLKKALFKDEKNEYFERLYYRAKVNMNPKPQKGEVWEYVEGWATIDIWDNDINTGFYKDYIYVKVKEVAQGDLGISKVHPISKKAWELGIEQLRPIVFPGLDPKNNQKNPILGLANSFGTSLNIITGPYENLKWKKIASVFKPKHSYLRLYHHNQFKKGGGIRVKKLSINDNWSNMNSGHSDGIYGQQYIYTTTDSYGTTISSGVASWEPFLGGNQNPNRKPEFYTIKQIWGPDKENYFQTPFLEQLYPTPNIGYSKVKVESIGNGNSPQSSTGYTINEFYTAKDFPIVEKSTPIQLERNGGKFGKWVKQLFSPINNEALAASQGYVLHLNDMHGKPKSVKIYGETDATGINLISGSDYYYQTDKNDPKILDNHVNLLTDSGTIVNAEIGMDYDVDFDMRKSFSNNWSAGSKLGFDLTGWLIILHAIPKFRKNDQLMQSIVTCKVIQRYGVLKEIKSYDYGSEVSTKNLLWDKVTGQVVLTQTQNEFNDPLFNFKYSAHSAYSGMSGAYQNIDHKEYDVNIANDGMATIAHANHYFPGDELLLKDKLNTHKRAWVLKTGNNKIKVIDRSGLPIPSGVYSIRVIRSGHKNMLNANVGEILTMNNPLNLNDGKVQLNQKVVSTSAVEYSDHWQSTLGTFLKYDRLCDTFEPAKQALLATAILKQAILSDSNSRLIYGLNSIKAADPLPLTDISWFDTSALKAHLDKYYFTNISDTCDKAYFIGSVYDGQGLSDNYSIQLRYKCDSNELWSNIFTCEITIGGGNWSTVDSLIECKLSYNEYNNPILATVYDQNGDSVTFDVIAPCFPRIITCENQLICQNNVGNILNPFVNGVRGTWRPKKTWAFIGDRIYTYLKDTTDIRQDGIIKNYTPFWQFESTGLKPSGQSNKHWVNTSTATLYTAKGNGVEEKDALDIYKSQLFGYDHTLVTAEAINAQYREIAFDNFEDYNYLIGNCQREGHFDFRNGLIPSVETVQLSNGESEYLDFSNTSGTAYIRKDTAHSGLYSFALSANSSHSLTRIIDTTLFVKVNEPDTGLFKINSIANTVPLFRPIPGKKYVLSAWVTEDISNVNDVDGFENAIINIKSYENGAITLDKDFTSSGLIIEGWQRIQSTFSVPNNTDSIKVTLVNLSNMHKIGFDDLRIQPFNSQMKGHVYNPILLKVMAELDENNYCTFYEYDSEGNLIRIKRESERGIMTIQENRKGIKKLN